MCTIGITIITTLVLVLQLGRAAAAVPSASTDVDSIEEREIQQLAEARDALANEISAAELERDVKAEHRLAADASSLQLTGQELDRIRKEIEDRQAKLRELVERRSDNTNALVALKLLEQQDRLKEQLRELNNRRRIVYLVAPSEPLLPLVTEVSGTRVIVSTDQTREAPMALSARQTDPEAAARAIIEVFRSLPDRERRYFLIVLKPSGIPVYLHLRAMLAADPSTRDVRIGLDLIPEDCWTTDEFPAADPAAGAGP